MRGWREDLPLAAAAAAAAALLLLAAVALLTLATVASALLVALAARGTPLASSLTTVAYTYSQHVVICKV